MKVELIFKMDQNSLFIAMNSSKTEKYSIYTIAKICVEVQSDSNEVRLGQEFQICIERHKTLHVFQIRIHSPNDRSLIYLCSIDHVKFHQMRSEQSLHISFEYFIDHLKKMLDECREGRLNIAMKLGNHEAGQLMIYEKGTFKDLVHISLPIERAPIEVILLYANESNENLKQQNNKLSRDVCEYEKNLREKKDQLHKANEELVKMQEDLRCQEKTYVSRLRDNTTRSEKEINQILESKELQRIDFEKKIAALHNQICDLMKENALVRDQFKMGVKKISELEANNKVLSTCKETLQEEKSNRMVTAKKTDLLLNELRKQLYAVEEKNLEYEKLITDLEAELSAEKKICQIKRDGLKMATEDICNANAIIRKQAKEIETLKTKIDLRTEVAIKQEGILREKTNSNDLIKFKLDEIEASLKENDGVSRVTEEKIDWICSQTKQIEEKYQNKIDEIYKKLILLNK